MESALAAGEHTVLINRNRPNLLHSWAWMQSAFQERQDGGGIWVAGKREMSNKAKLHGSTPLKKRLQYREI